MGQKILTSDDLLERCEVVRPTFEAIYAEWFHEVSRWARALGGLQADLDDLTQDVFLVVRRKLPDFDGENLRGWLYRITQRTVGDYRRRAWFRGLFWRAGEETTEFETAQSGRYPDPSDVLERRRAEAVLGEILEHLSAKRRTAFVLFEIEGYSGEEIACLEGVPLNTVWSRLHAARRDFFTLLAERHAAERAS